MDRAGATVVPAQAVQTGPDSRFVYVVGPEHKVERKAVKLAYIEDGIAVIEGVSADARVVTEGAQNLRPGTVIAEAPADGKAAARSTKGGAAKGEGKRK